MQSTFPFAKIPCSRLDFPPVVFYVLFYIMLLKEILRTDRKGGAIMALLYINARCKQILNFLLTQTKYITTEQIGAEMKVSKRTVYYDICKINLWLEQS
jgi:hypothetical protein